MIIHFNKCLIDTNVPKTANLATDPTSIPDELVECVLACVEHIEQVVKKGGLVVDAGDEMLKSLNHSNPVCGFFLELYRPEGD